MSTVYILVVCIGMFWNSMCGTVYKFSYPTLESCQAEQVRAAVKINDGWAYCVEVQKK